MKFSFAKCYIVRYNGITLHTDKHELSSDSYRTDVRETVKALQQSIRGSSIVIALLFLQLSCRRNTTASLPLGAWKTCLTVLEFTTCEMKTLCILLTSNCYDVQDSSRYVCGEIFQLLTWYRKALTIETIINNHQKHFQIIKRLLCC